MWNKQCICAQGSRHHIAFEAQMARECGTLVLGGRLLLQIQETGCRVSMSTLCTPYHHPPPTLGAQTHLCTQALGRRHGVPPPSGARKHSTTTGTSEGVPTGHAQRGSAHQDPVDRCSIVVIPKRHLAKGHLTSFFLQPAPMPYATTAVVKARTHRISTTACTVSQGDFHFV